MRGGFRHEHTAAPDVLPERETSFTVVLGLAMGPAVALGLARFAYALLLPAMKASLGWGYAEAGAMNTANALGYLVGAQLAPRIAARVGLRMAFAMSLGLTAIAIVASGLTASFDWLLVLRCAAGSTGAVAFVSGGALVTAAAATGRPTRAATLLGIYFAGAGIGILLSALVVPASLKALGWQTSWVTLGVVAICATMLGAIAAHRVPNLATPLHGRQDGHWRISAMAAELVAYLLFGAGYIAYATFIIAYVRAADGFSTTQITIFWALLGGSAIFAAFAWSPFLARARGGWGAAATIWITAIGAAIPLVLTGSAAAYASAFVFGSAFLAVIAAVTAFARRAAPPESWTSAIAALTVAFGIGQSVGPILTGALMDRPGGLAQGLWISVVVLVVAGLVATLQRETNLAR